MSDTTLAAVVMAGGLGTRMRSALPKHFHPILGRRMVDWVIADRARGGSGPAGRHRLARGADEFAESDVTVAVQEQPLGTGDAVRSARAALEGYEGDVLVLSGDTPLLTAELLGELVATHRRAGGGDDPQRRAARPARLRPHRPGRRRLGPAHRRGNRRSPEEQRIREINSSIYVFRSAALWPAIEQLQPKNVQGELYLTDVIEILVAGGAKVAAHIAADHARPTA